MKTFSQTILLGAVGADPEIAADRGGRYVATFRIATDDKMTNPGGESVELTNWHNCRAIGAQAERISDMLTKGAIVQIVGRVFYIDEGKGERTFKKTFIMVDDFTLCRGGKPPAKTFKTVADMRAGE